MRLVALSNRYCKLASAQNTLILQSVSWVDKQISWRLSQCFYAVVIYFRSKIWCRGSLFEMRALNNQTVSKTSCHPPWFTMWIRSSCGRHFLMPGVIGFRIFVHLLSSHGTAEINQAKTYTSIESCSTKTLPYRSIQSVESPCEQR